jgi:4-amino-4-deoxy-L-arabinose transferase-like glycosyltransferase
MAARGISTFWARSRHALIPAAVALLLCVPGLGQGALATDTAWYTAIAWRAWSDALGGDLGSLWTLRGVADQHYFNKPPLAFWLGGAPLAALGPSVVGARLGGVAACVLCVLATARLGRLLAGRAVGLGAGLVLATTWEFVRHSHAFSLDLWMTLFVLLACCAAAAAHATDRPRGLIIAGAWVGAALMVKPIVPLLALPMLAAWLCIVGRSRWLGRVALAAVVAAAVAAPWHVSMWAMHGEAFTAQYFGREIIDRAAGPAAGTPGGAAVFNTGSDSALYYVREVARSYWPWLATVALAFVALARGEGTRPLRAALWLALVWCAAWFVLLSIFPDKRPRYLLVIYPLGAVASGVLLARLAPRTVRAAWRGIALWAAPVAAAACVGLVASGVRLHRPPHPQWAALAAWLAEDPSRELRVGALAPQRGAQVFLDTGRWPAPTRDAAGRVIAAPGAGALLIYHRRDGWAPGEHETVAFELDDLVVTRLEREPWTPRAVADPGE